MSIILEQHKKELLKITEDYPADIALLINYIDKTFKCHIHDLSLSDQKDLKFFIAKSFANQIDACKTKEHAQNFLQELQELWGELFEETLEDKPVYSLDIDGTTYHAELDFTELNQNNMLNTEFSETSLDLNLIETLPNFSSDKQKYKGELAFTELKQNNFANIYLEKQQYNSQTILISNIQNNYILFPKIINLKEKVTIEILNDLLLLGTCNKRNFFESSEESEIYFILPNNERLAMKVFSLNNQPIHKNGKFKNAILFLSKKINEHSGVDYSEGFSADIADGEINSSYITPLGEIMDFN